MGPPDAPPGPHHRLASLNCRLEDLEQAPGLWEAKLQQTWLSLGRELGSLTRAAGELEQRPGLRDGLLGPGHRLGMQSCPPGAPPGAPVHSVSAGADLPVWDVTGSGENMGPPAWEGLARDGEVEQGGWGVTSPAGDGGWHAHGGCSGRDRGLCRSGSCPVTFQLALAVGVMPASHAGLRAPRPRPRGSRRITRVPTWSANWELQPRAGVCRGKGLGFQVI